MNPESLPLPRRITPDTSRTIDRFATPPRGEGLGAPDLPVEWQHLWFALARQRWSALALVPAHPSLSTIAMARRLLAVGQAYSASRVHLVDASASDSANARVAISEIERCTAGGEQCLVALASPITRPAAIGIARAAGAALLLVPLGTAEIGGAREAIACIGREHFLGAVSVQRRA